MIGIMHVSSNMIGIMHLLSDMIEMHERVIKHDWNHAPVKT